MTSDGPLRIYQREILVQPGVIDANGHVNNVAYLQWMQEVAVAHSDATGGTDAMRAAGGTWVARSHRVEYLRPAFEGESIRVRTWVVDAQRATSLRRYRFLRVPDGAVLATGETVWVFVSMANGRPRSIPPGVLACFPLVPEE